MNVLLVVPWDQETGGVANVVTTLGRHFQGEGHRVLFLHPGTSEVMKPKKTKTGFDGVEVKLRAPFNPNFPVRSVLSFLLMLPWTLLQLALVLRRNAIDLVNIHYPGEHFVYFAFMRPLLRIRLVISIHGTDAVRWQGPAAEKSQALRLLFRAADLVVAPSWGFLRRCNELLAPVSARRIAIHNGTDVAELEAEAANVAPTQQPFVLSVCSLDEWKGVDVLIRAAAIASGAPPVIVAGEGPQRQRLEALIEELQLRDRVKLIGQQSRASVARLLHDCTMFVLASRFETFGIAALEAMAAGKAVIGTKVDGILEIVEHDVTGLTVEPDDASGLAAAMQRLSTNGDLRERLGRAAAARVREHFQRRRMGERYTKEFQELVGARAESVTGRGAVTNGV